jgi:uncharacterized protein YprB with RNaseH-like and TPR domain
MGDRDAGGRYLPQPAAGRGRHMSGTAASEASRLRRAAASLRDRGDRTRQREVEAPSGARPGWASDYWGQRRAHLRRIAGEFSATVLGEDAEYASRAACSPGVHEFRYEALAGEPVLPTISAAEAAVLGCLELVAGVGPVTASRLRAAGVTTIAQLVAYPALRRDARLAIAEWERADLSSVCNRLTRRLGGLGHLLSALVCSTVAMEDVAFLDLETMGLWNNTVFLAGIGRIAGGAFHVHQYLAPDHADEPAVVARALAQLSEAKVVVTFNGRSADLPWLAGRAFYYGLGPVPPLAHVDLLYGTRRRYVRDEGRLACARLPEVSDELLQLSRPCGDVPSWIVPEIYDHYTRAPAKREGMLVPLLSHNRADLRALVSLLELLSREAVRVPAACAG